MSPMIYTIFGFAIFFFVFWCGLCLLHILALSYGKYKLYRKIRIEKKPVARNNETADHQQQQTQHIIVQSNPVKVIEQSDDFKCLQQELQQPAQQLPITQQHDEQQPSHKLQSQIAGLSSNACNNSLTRDKSSAIVPSISILKPLMGIDPNLLQNLETFFTMNYETYELLFCVESSSDPVIVLVDSLRQKYPLIDSRLFIGGSNVGVNPKINNMHPGYLAAKYDMIMISDSGIKMKEDTLLDMISYMTDKVGLVHQLPFTCDREGFAATFEKIFFGTMQSRIYLSADSLGINCHTGMSCIMRKNVLEQLGGLKAFGRYLAEDFFIAQAFVDNGWKLAISSQPALQNSGVCDIASFQARLTRWAKLRVAMVPTMILLEPLSECMVLGALASWSVTILFHWDFLVFFLVHVLMWLMSDWLMLSIVQNGSLPFNRFEFVIGWLLRECTGPYLFFNALWNPAIRWRERVIRLAWGGVAHEIYEPTDTEKEKILATGQFDDMPKMRSTHAMLTSKCHEPIGTTIADNEKCTLVAQQSSQGNVPDDNIAHSEWLDCTSTESSVNDDYRSSQPQHRHTCISISIGP